MLPPPLHCKSPSIRQTQTPSLTPSLGMLTKQSLKGDFVLLYRQLRKSLTRMVHFHSHQVFLDALMLIFSVSCYLQLNFSPRRTANHIVLLHMLSDKKQEQTNASYTRLALSNRDKVRIVGNGPGFYPSIYGWKNFLAHKHNTRQRLHLRSKISLLSTPQSLLLLGISPLLHP